MKNSAILKSAAAFIVLLCWAGVASAQYDVDVDNQTPCAFRVRYINDDGTGTCTTCSSTITSPANSFNTYSCGATSGAVFHVAITDGVVPAVTVGDCSLTSCPCSGLPSSTSISTSCGTWNIVYFPPTTSANAYVLIY